MKYRYVDPYFRVEYDKQSDILTVYRSNGYLKLKLSWYVDKFKPRKRMAIMRKWSNIK